MVSAVVSGLRDDGLRVVGPGFRAFPSLCPLYPYCALSRGVEAVVFDVADALDSLCHEGSGVAPASLCNSLSDCHGDSSIPAVSLSSCARGGVPKHVENKSQRMARRRAAISGRSWTIRSTIVMYTLVQETWAMGLLPGAGFLASPTRSPTCGSVWSVEVTGSSSRPFGSTFAAFRQELPHDRVPFVRWCRFVL